MILNELRALDRPQRAAFTASLLGWSLDAFDFFTLVFVVSDIAAAFHTKVSAVSLAIALTLVARPAGAFVFGWLADRYGRRPVLMANVGLYALLAFASAFAPNLTTLLVLRCLFGFAMGGEWGVGASLALESVPAKSRGVVSGLLQGGYPLGYLLASVANLFVDQIGWRGMLMLGALPALLVLYIRREVKESPAFEAARAGGRAPPAPRRPGEALAPRDRARVAAVQLATLVAAGLVWPVRAAVAGAGPDAGWSVGPAKMAGLGLGAILAGAAVVATMRLRRAPPPAATHYAYVLRTFWIGVAATVVAALVLWPINDALGQLGLTPGATLEGAAALLALWFLVRGALGLAPAAAGRGLRPAQTTGFFGAIGRAWPRLLYLALLMTAFNVFSHGTHDLYPTFLKLERGYAPGLVTGLTIVGNVGAILGGLLFGAVSERIGRRRAIALAALIVLPAIPLWAYGATPLLLALGGFVVNLSVQGAWGVVPVHLNELSPQEARGTFPGFTYQLGNLMASGITVFQSLIAEGRVAAARVGDPTLTLHQVGAYSFAQALTVGGIGVVLAVMAVFGPEAKGVAFVRGAGPPTPAD